VGKLLGALRVDFAPLGRAPSVVSVGVAAAAALALSIGADSGLVALATRAFPSTRGYGHFAFADYSTLTIIGVVVACAAWPVVTRVASTPRPAFFRMAVFVTFLLWLPDLWLLIRHQPPRAVGVLMAMHLAIALVTYNLLVHVAPARAPTRGRADGENTANPTGPPATARQDGFGAPRPTRVMWIAMAIAVGLELALGLATLVLVPIGRPDGLVPPQGRVVYVAHAVAGAVLVIGAASLLIKSRRAGRAARIGATMGGVGILLGAGGGVLAVYHPARLAGLGLMLLGPLVAGIGYLGPLLEGLPAPEP
jgi:hypothetical protein